MVRTVTDEEIVHKMTYLNMRTVAADFKLEPGAHYVLMPSTFEPNVCMPYTLEFYADEDIVVKRIAEPEEKSIQGEWKGKTAGGSVNHPATWKNNPQYVKLPPLLRIFFFFVYFFLLFFSS